MKKLVCGLTLCLSVGNIFAGSTKDIYKKNWIDFNKNGVKDVYEDPAAPIEARVADLLSQMTLEEKTCQMATLYGPLPNGQRKSGKTVSGILTNRRTDWVNSVPNFLIRMPTV